MGTKPLGERIGAERIGVDHAASVRSAIRRETTLAGFLDETSFLLRADGWLKFVLVSGLGLMMLLIGVFVGRIAFGTTVIETAPSDNSVVISRSLADEYQHLAMDLEQAEGDLAVSNGVAAFHEAQAGLLAEEVSRLNSRLSLAQLERDLIVNIYEECVERLYPLECISNAEPELDGFLAELYAEDG